jgi:superfamily II DNA helicase RecQ
MSLKFNITELNKYQKLAIRKFVLEDKEVFVNLPTGSGKSLIYQGLPVIFDTITRTSGHIVAVLSPRLNLINHQVNHLNCLAGRLVNLSNVTNEEERIMVEHGAFSIVYGTPEAWLKNER